MMPQSTTKDSKLSDQLKQPFELTLNETSQAELFRQQMNRTGDFSFLLKQKGPTQLNSLMQRTLMNVSRADWRMGSPEKVVPQTATSKVLVGSRRASHGTKFFFATKMTSDSIGEKEDPRQARKTKLSQILNNSQMQERTHSNADRELANLIYGTQVASTQKNLVGVRSIRHSLLDMLVQETSGNPAAKKSPTRVTSRSNTPLNKLAPPSQPVANESQRAAL